MKIKVKGFKSLYKAVRNRAHLFPVKVLIRAKNKTYYGIRYKTGNRAMEFTKKQMKIPNNVEVLFDTIDGKRKNITENDVLRIYDKAGKPGSLQEFIEKNFKKPYVKPRNSTKVDSKPREDAKVKDNKQETQIEDKETQRKERKLKFYHKKYNDGSLLIDTGNMGDVYDENFNKAERETDKRNILAIILNNEIYHMQNKASFSDLSTYETVRKNYLRHKELRNILTGKTLREPYISSNSDRPAYWQKAVEVGVRELSDLLEFDNDYKNGRYDNYNVAYDYIPRMLCQQGANIWGKHEMKRLYFNAAGDSIVDRIASEQNIDKGSRDYDALEYYTHSMHLDLDKDKLYIEKDGSNNKYLDGSTREKILTYAREKINELESEKTGDKNKPSKDSIMTIEQEKMLLRRLKARRMPDNPFIIRPDEGAMMRLTGIRDYNNMNGEPTEPGRAKKIRGTLDTIDLDLNTGKATVEGTKDSETLSIAQEAINKLISEIKAETHLDPLAVQNKALKEQRNKQRAKEVEFKPEHIDGGDYGKIIKFGTKKIKSKGEYAKAKDLNDFVNKAKAVKDFHLDIKGRAMLDMFGIACPLFNKRNGKAISVDRYTKAMGYCARMRNGDTVEIALVAETGDTVGETKTTIHECMHSKLRNGISEAMEGVEFKDHNAGKNIKETIRHAIEETIVEVAGQGVSNLIHGNETDEQRWSYEGIVARTIPAILGVPEFSEARKKGLHGIGQEICKNLMNDNREFVQNVVDRYIENPEISKYIKTPIENKSGDMIEKRMKAIETKVLERTDKVEKIKNDTGKSEIANLVEELKKGTISLEGALNSAQYGELAAVLITKFLEDEDLEALEGLALSF